MRQSPSKFTGDQRLPQPKKLSCGPSLAEYAFGALLAATSGAAVVAQTLGWAQMRHTAPFVVLPTAALLVAIALLGAGKHTRYRQFARRIMIGALWGLIATLFYDVIRPPIGWALRSEFNPYGAMPLFGNLITGLPGDHATAIAVGWIYHFWNGISFGMMFALVWPRGGLVSGVVWGASLQLLMMALYPVLLQVRLDNPGFLWTGMVGHATWGAVLGFGIRRWGRLKPQV